MIFSNIIYRWGLLRTFAVSSIVTIMLIMSISGYLLFNFMHDNLLHIDAQVSTDLIQSISSFSNLENYFDETSKYEDKVSLIQFFERVMESPDMYRVVVYNSMHRVLWSNDKNIVGRIFSNNNDLNHALTGSYIFKEKTLVEHRKNSKLEHDFLPDNITQFIESYIPIWNRSHTRVLGVIELYKSPKELYSTINKGRIMVIMFSIFSGITLYWFLYWIVKTAHILIGLQSDKIKQANSRVAEINEHNLRRIGSELHDGPTQTISFAVLKLEVVMSSILHCRSHEESEIATSEISAKEVIGCQPQTQFKTVVEIQSALKESLKEIRSLSSGLVIPDLTELTINKALEKVIETHEARTGTKVKYKLVPLPELMDTAKKICLYRLTQEGLNNSFKHGKGIKQKVITKIEKDFLTLNIIDSGPGISKSCMSRINETDHLGLRGLRERIESLGGQFEISKHKPNKGVKLSCTLPLF